MSVSPSRWTNFRRGYAIDSASSSPVFLSIVVGVKKYVDNHPRLGTMTVGL
jgi:hypothetical protein